MSLRLFQKQKTVAKSVMLPLPPPLLPVLPPKGPFPRNHIYPLGGVHLLIACRHQKIAILLKKLFEISGARVTLSFTDEETLVCAIMKDIDLLIGDASPEDNSGLLALIIELRKMGKTMPIITMVERDFKQHKKYSQYGVTDFVAKPLAMDVLQQKVHDLLNR